MRGYVRSHRRRMKMKKIIAIRQIYLISRAHHDESCLRTRSISLSLLLKPLNSPAGCHQHARLKINHRDARAAQDVAPCDRGNKLRVRSTKGHIVAFTATFAYIRGAINIVQHNLRWTVHAPRDDVSPRVLGMHAKIAG